MKSIFFITLFLIAFIPLPASAQDDDVCRYLDAYQRDDSINNSAVYEPGVDVHGRPVAPADLNDKSAMMADIIRIPLTIDLAVRYGLSVPQSTEIEPVIGELVITNDGRVMWGAQDFTAETVALCRGKQLKTEDTTTAEMPEAEEHQDSEEADEDLIWGESYLE